MACYIDNEAQCSDDDSTSDIDLTCDEKFNFSNLDELVDASVHEAEKQSGFISDDEDPVLHVAHINPKPRRKLVRSNAMVRSPKPKTKRRTKYQIRSMVNLFTLQNCDLDSSQDVLNLFHQYWRQNFVLPVKIVVAKEQHQSGFNHFHIVAYYASKPSYYIDPVLLAAYFQSSNFNISSARYRSWKNALKYCTKSSTDIVSWPETYEYGEDLEVELKISEKVYLELKQGTSMDKLLELYTPYMMSNYSKVEKIRNLLKDSSKRQEPKGLDALWTQFIPDALMNDHSKQIASWLQTNLGRERRFRTKNLWIEGAPGIGKSFTMHLLGEYIRIYYLTELENWYRFDEDEYDLIVLDEWKGGRPDGRGRFNVQLFNHLLDGSRVILNMKFGNTIKTKNLPFIVLSNFRISEVYKDSPSPEFRAIQDRFTEVWFGVEELRLFHLPDYLEEDLENQSPPPQPPKKKKQKRPKGHKELRALVI